MIRITIKVSNDHCSMSEQFEAIELMLSVNDPSLKSMVEQVVQKFNQPVDEVIVKTKMEV